MGCRRFGQIWYEIVWSLSSLRESPKRSDKVVIYAKNTRARIMGEGLKGMGIIRLNIHSKVDGNVTASPLFADTPQTRFPTHLHNLVARKPYFLPRRPPLPMDAHYRRFSSCFFRTFFKKAINIRSFPPFPPLTGSCFFLKQFVTV